MKKRIVSMILALSMVLSILPVSAFADAGAGFSSAAAEETNSITYSSEEEHEAVGKNSETNNQVVKIEVGTNGLPKAASGTGWSYDETTGLTITGTGSEDTEYILDGTVSCNVTVKNANSHTVYLLDGTVTGTLLIEADNMYGVRVLGGSYADVQLNLGTIDGGTYDKLTENGGNVRGGFFRDISGLSADTQQQAHQLLLPENCTLNGQKETKIYIIKKYNYSGNGNDLELVVESDTGCDVWAVASTGGSVMALPAGTQNYAFTYFDSTIATISISADGKTLSASFNMIPAQNGAPMKLVPMALGATELRFNNEGQPDLTDVTYVDSLDTDAKLHRVYMGNGWGYNCYPNDSSNESTLQILNQGGANFDFSALSDVPINCYVEITNANITGGEFGENGRLTITSGKISGGTFHNVSAGINSINGNSAVEITGGTFDSLFCNGSCSIANAVIQSCNFNTYGNNTYTISDTVLGELPDGIQKLLPAGQQLSTLVVRNGGVTAMNGRTLPLSTNTIYLVGAGSAELTLNTDVLSINDAPVENYNANTSADGKVLRITGKNDGAKIFVNKSTNPSDLKPLRITEKGLPDLTGVTGVPMSGEGMTANLYEGLGWKYATMEENGRTRAALYITTPDGNPVDLSSDTINPYHKAIAVEQITFANVTVTGIVAEGSVGAENTIIQDGTFQKDVYMDENSTIAGGTFQDVVRAYGKITGGSFIAEVQLNQNSEVTGGVFHDVQLPSYATEKTVIQNAVILGSLKTDSDSKAAISNTVSCGYIESRFLAAGQQQSKLMMTDGTVERLNDYAAATDAVYLIGNVKAEIRFSNAVTNINGEDVSAYNGAQLSADGKTLTLTAKNDGEPIVVNMATTGKLPFSSLSKSDFTVSGTIEHQTVKSSKDGVGKLSLVYVRTYDNEVFETYPAGADMYGLYKQRIVAQEGDKYTEGSLDIGEVVRRYQPKLDDFEYDPKTQTATYKGPMYFDDAPLYSIRYVPEDGSFPSVTKPTKAGTYSVDIVVDSSDHYVGNQYEVDTYTVSESKYTLTVDDKSTEHVAGEKLSFTADEKDGYTFTGWKVTGLPTDVDTTKATISFTMPANNVTLKAQYTENAPKTYKLDVTDAQVTLKDGSAVADLTAVSVGTELKATADEDTETSVFKSWNCTGLELTEEQSTARVVYFTMPDHDVNLKAEFVTPTNKLEVTDAKVTLKDGGAVADLTAVPVGTELKAIAYEDTETSVFKSWSCTGLELTEEQSTARVVYFTMPDHDVNLKAEFVTP
ncbi:MAG: InlB B-repeat-containing protein, partial [Faecalibacterium prausnitzii]